MKQVIIVRKDLKMSPGKTAAQVAHASSMFMMNWFKENCDLSGYAEGVMNKNILSEWMEGEYTKCILGAKNKSQLLKAMIAAESAGMEENKDFFLIYDNCHTELEPEEDGRTLTCIGFLPMGSEKIDAITKRYQLYK